MISCQTQVLDSCDRWLKTVDQAVILLLESFSEKQLLIRLNHRITA